MERNRNFNTDKDLNRTSTVGTIAPLDELDDFEVADGDPDVRGWDVMMAGNRKIGEVHELLVDTGAMRVRYLDVDLEKDFDGPTKDRHILVPIGCARLDDDNDHVLIGDLTPDTLKTAPEYRHGPLTPELESSVRGCFGAGTTGGKTTDKIDYDRDELFSDRKFWGQRRAGRENAAYLTRSEEELAVGKRKQKAGEVEVSKDVRTEHVKQAVPVEKERVTVERRPASGATRAEIGEGEIRVPVMEEEAVVQKRAVPKEEVVIKKETVQDRDIVEADLRKERIHVDKEGDVRRTR